MLSERHTHALRDSEALALSAQTLAEYGLDLPFVLLYTLKPNGDQAGWSVRPA